MDNYGGSADQLVIMQIVTTRDFLTRDLLTICISIEVNLY